MGGRRRKDEPNLWDGIGGGGGKSEFSGSVGLLLHDRYS
jgi:hypothetical protein